VHLLAALDQRAGAVLAQASVDGKTNEITAFAPLLEPLDLAGCVITADAMHTQRGHAEFVVAEKKAHYILAVKKNRPGLYAQVKNLPWRNIPAGCTQHGREEHRTLQVTAVAAGLAFPHAAQAIRLTRRTRPWAARRNGAPSLSTRSPAWTPARLPPASSPPGYAATGRSRCCTTSATSATGKTLPRSAPAAAPRSWLPCATSASGS